MHVQIVDAYCTCIPVLIQYIAYYVAIKDQIQDNLDNGIHHNYVD